MLKIFFGTNESGVAYWRGKLPGYKLMEKGLADVKMFSVYDMAPHEVEPILGDIDIAYIPSPCDIGMVTEMVAYFQSGIRTIADYDDNLYDCHPFNPGYKTLGLKNVTVRMPDGRVLDYWKDGVKGFSIRDNAIRYQAYVDILHVADSITTTTPYLKDKIKVSAPERDDSDFRVVPNSIDFSIFKPFGKRCHSRDKVRIGWTASDSHLTEGVMFKKIFNELKKRYPGKFQMVVLGNVAEMRLHFIGEDIEWHEFVDLSVYPMKLASLDIDVAIAPLEDCSFNRAKSQLKWSEFSSLSIPTVCSNLEPYDIIRDGIDGFLSKDTQEFGDKVGALIDDEGLRAKMGAAAYERNYADYNLDKNVSIWMDVFEQAMAKEREIYYKGQRLTRIKEMV